MYHAQYSVAELTLLGTSFAWAADGLIAVPSTHDVKTTMDRLETVVKQKDMNVFARIDHAAGAAKIGKSLRPTELLIVNH